ncbi:MAG: hypothetical protein ACTSU5_06070, partial [Promethearchaeota archaeon]
MRKKAIILSFLTASMLFAGLGGLFIPEAKADYLTDPTEPNGLTPYNVTDGSAHDAYWEGNIGGIWTQMWSFISTGLNMADEDNYYLWVDAGTNVTFDLLTSTYEINVTTANQSGVLDQETRFFPPRAYHYTSYGSVFWLNISNGYTANTTDFTFNVTLESKPKDDQFEDNDFGNTAAHPTPTYSDSAYEEYYYSSLALLDNDYYNFTVNPNDEMKFTFNTTLFTPPSFSLMMYNETQLIESKNQADLIWDALMGHYVTVVHKFSDIDHQQQVEVYLSYTPNWPSTNQANYTMNATITFGVPTGGSDDQFEDNDFLSEAAFPMSTYSDSSIVRYDYTDLNFSDFDYYNYSVDPCDRINMTWFSTSGWDPTIQINLYAPNGTAVIYRDDTHKYWDFSVGAWAINFTYDVVVDEGLTDFWCLGLTTALWPPGGMEMYSLNVSFEHFKACTGCTDDILEENDVYTTAKEVRTYFTEVE